MMRHAYRHRNANKRALFVLSANNFNDAMRRWRYFVRYDEQRKRQITLVGKTQESLNQKIVILQATKDSKQELLVENEQQNEERSKALENQEKLLDKLKEKEADIQADLTEKEAAKARLTDAIDRAIRADLRKAQATARKSNKGKPRKLSASDKKISTAFRKAKRKLPMPVKGVITGKYGTQKHPTLKRITIKNNGIDIKTYKNSKVKAVFRGEVINVFAIPGAQNAVMIRHGNYYSVYSNLRQVTVSKGQKIKQGQVVGIVGVSAKTNQSELHLEIWKDSKHLNPSAWLKK
jgi:septal ring factor EnvC (AmiA/AmiB activator)